MEYLVTYFDKDGHTLESHSIDLAEAKKYLSEYDYNDLQKTDSITRIVATDDDAWDGIASYRVTMIKE